jgi:hypothetical protein
MKEFISRMHQIHHFSQHDRLIVAPPSRNAQSLQGRRKQIYQPPRGKLLIVMKKVNHLQLKIFQFSKLSQRSNPLVLSLEPLQQRVGIRVQTQCFEGIPPRLQVGYYRGRPFEHEWTWLVVVLERLQPGAECYQALEPHAGSTLPQLEMRYARRAIPHLRKKPIKIFDHLSEEYAQRRQVDEWQDFLQPDHTDSSAGALEKHFFEFAERTTSLELVPTQDHLVY